MLLEPGLRIAIDPKKPPTALRYTFCRPDAPVCLSYSEISADFVNELKKNKSAVVQMLNLSKRTINLEFMLTDFTKSYDGPAIDPKVVEQQQKKLQEELQKRAEEARKKLLEGQAKK
jgi:invasion protein IalB